jgi:hypothetical protein
MLFMARFWYVLFAASALSCGPVHERDLDDRVILLGDDYYSAKERLLEAGAFEITNLVHFYLGQSPYSVSKTKEGVIIVSAHLLVYTPHPSQEIRGWFLLPNHTCVSLFVRRGNASRIVSIELGRKGKGFLPPAEAINPEHFSPPIERNPDADGDPVTIEREETAPDPTIWSR